MNKLIKVIASLTIASSIAGITTVSVSHLTETIAKASSISPAKVKKGNSAIKKSLKEDQDFYNGGDERYEWASYVKSIKINENKQLTVQMKAQALSMLNKEQREKVGIKAEKLATSSLMIEDIIKPEDTTNGLFTSLWSGNRAIGQSRLGDYYKFKMHE